MVTSAAVEIAPLNAITAGAFHNFTFRSYQFVLYQLRENGPVFAFGGFVDGKPGGMVLCEQGPKVSTILSIFVAAEFRNQGLGSALLQEAQKELERRDASPAYITYVTGRTGTAALERVLAKCGWPAPEPKHLVCKGDKRMNEWMSQYTLPSTFDIFPWVEITPEDRASLERSQAAENWVPEGLWPFDYEATMEPANSLGIRYKGELAGWLITQPREPDTVCYSCSYMRPDLQRRGRLVAVYAEAVRRQVEFTNKPYGIWIVPYKHEAMAQFVLRRMRPYLITLEEFRHSTKFVGGSSVGARSAINDSAQEVAA
jgi:GNAT superfamily N-acetyltransferase